MEYKKLNHIINSHRKTTSVSNVQDLDNLMKKITSGFSINAFVDSILSDEQYLFLVGKESYSHEMGFDKIVVSPYRDGNYQLRFNIWWQGQIADNNHYEDIHNHRWDFSTRILKGSYRYENYKVGLEGQDYLHYRYHPLSNGNFRFEYHNRAAIELESCGELSEGDSMTVGHDVFHRVMPFTNEPVCTFFLNNKPCKDHSDLFRHEEIVANYREQEISLIPIEELKKKFLDLLYLLTS